MSQEFLRPIEEEVEAMFVKAFVEEAFRKARADFRNFPGGPASIPAAQLQYEITLMQELAWVIEKEGLVATLRAAHQYHSTNDLPDAPPVLEPFFEGEKSRWAKKAASQPRGWIELLARHGLNEDDFLTWKNVTIDNLEDDIGEIFGRIVEADIIARGGMPAIVMGDLGKCRVRFCGSVSFNLPAWEATAILDCRLGGILDYIGSLDQNIYHGPDTSLYDRMV